MKSIAQKLVREISGVARVCGPLTGLKYLAACLTAIPGIARTKTLQPADERMGTVSVTCKHGTVAYPSKELDAANTLQGDSPAFSAIREIFARDVYGHGFTTLPKIKTMLDLGANRGVVTLYGVKSLGAEWVCGIDPTDGYDKVFAHLADANDLAEGQRHRIKKFVGSAGGEETLTVGMVLKDHGIAKLDFLKCDIEGGENAVFLEDPAEFLNVTDRLVMELHPAMGSRSEEIGARLSAAGFSFKSYDADKRPCDLARADYLFASKNPGELR
ncbi:MAG: FkbM family methyltransferase [Pseudomonadota bacterium]